MALVLGIETSCDETAVAILENGQEIRANLVFSQVKDHQKFGGVVPEIASRKHLETLPLLFTASLQEAGVSLSQIDAIAVTQGPGLIGSLLVGVSFAKALAYARKIALIKVHHLVGHLYAGFLAYPELTLPLVGLIVSGGHTSLVYLARHGEIKILGATRDDAAGEVLDKIARFLGLGYPGGPQIELLARTGDPTAISFPRAWLGESLDFSFSGLKTAVINFWHRTQAGGEKIELSDLAASFQQAIIEVLVVKTLRAATELKTPRILVAGGVAANQALRKLFEVRCRDFGCEVFFPPPELCTDNAAMIACVGEYKYRQKEFTPLSFEAQANLPLAW